MTIVAVKKEYKLPYGNCIINSKDLLIRIEEKPKYKFLVNTGLYLFDQDIKIYKKIQSDFDQLVKNVQKNKLKIGIFSVEMINGMMLVNGVNTSKHNSLM